MVRRQYGFDFSEDARSLRGRNVVMVVLVLQPEIDWYSLELYKYATFRFTLTCNIVFYFRNRGKLKADYNIHNECFTLRHSIF